MVEQGTWEGDSDRFWTLARDPGVDYESAAMRVRAPFRAG